jgi:hypothetical protein
VSWLGDNITTRYPGLGIKPLSLQTNNFKSCSFQARSVFFNSAAQLVAKIAHFLSRNHFSCCSTLRNDEKRTNFNRAPRGVPWNDFNNKKLGKLN